MNKEKDINNYRFFKVTDDVMLDGVPLKKGDIIVLSGFKIKSLALEYNRGMVFDIGRDFDGVCYHPDGSGIWVETKDYPMDDKPFSIQEYIKMLPKITMDRPTPAKIYLKPGQEIFLSKELLIRMFRDNCHKGWNWEEGFHTRNPISLNNIRKLRDLKEYNSISLNLISSNTDSNSTIKLLNELPKTDNDLQSLEERLSVKLSENYTEGQIPDELKPGLYSVTGKLSVWAGTPFLTIYFDKGETIDCSKPEYALLLLDKDFLRFLDKSSEISNQDEKKKIYSEWQEGVLENGTRYFKLKEGADYTKFIYDVDGRMKKRIREPEPDIEAVEENNGRVVLKVKPSDVTFTAVMDRELSKIGKKLPTEEATHYQLMEASTNQKQNEEHQKERAKELGIKNYFSFKMKAELAETRAKEYPDKDELLKKAYDYLEQHRKRYYRYHDITSFLSVQGFYLMENAEVKNDKEVARIYGQKQQVLQTAALNAFRQISNKENEGTEK